MRAPRSNNRFRAGGGVFALPDRAFRDVRECSRCHLLFKYTYVLFARGTTEEFRVFSLSLSALFVSSPFFSIFDHFFSHIKNETKKNTRAIEKRREREKKRTKLLFADERARSTSAFKLCFVGTPPPRRRSAAAWRRRG